ncbi:3-demethoxyubiquinol 3-hydroxylase [Vreelandella nigrificans]|uniref:3-demethoxyubiquinol 3-hydroxylase n=1 Tax=Vreelandella nigrificans TaxID=2042704 RepID=UPI001FCAD017|nr:demethoxyubiquinone hydroxylase family protein [Halomonas nigrificans]
MLDRQMSRSDRLITHMDNALRTLVSNAVITRRVDPSAAVAEMAFDDVERRHVAGVVRSAHLATVSVQGFCQGQMALIKLPASRRQVEPSQQETIDHLAWCNQRLVQLNSRTSYFMPACYGVSLGLGLTAGAISDRFGLGVAAVTKELISQQLNEQSTQLPEGDQRTRTLFRQMAADNRHHAQLSVEASGTRFPAPVKWGIRIFTGGILKVAYYT